ncbi:MAG: hypothetical protein AAF353_16285, partial [Pseudomonadota bacterium]
MAKRKIPGYTRGSDGQLTQEPDRRIILTAGCRILPEIRRQCLNEYGKYGVHNLNCSPTDRNVLYLCNIVYL